jgi:ComF family protein
VASVPLLVDLLDLLIPPTCAGCGLEGEPLCEACLQPLHRRLDEPAGTPIGLPTTLPDGLVQLEWCATFSGSVRAAIHSLKYKGQRRLAEPLGDALASRWRRAGLGADTVTWVPVHAERERERGFDQAELLAVVVGQRLGLPVVRCLERAASTRAMHALDRGERTRNVSGAFALASDAAQGLPGRWPLIVDDVVTTGATLSGCAGMLASAGTIAVSGLAIARDR